MLELMRFRPEQRDKMMQLERVSKRYHNLSTLDVAEANVVYGEEYKYPITPHTVFALRQIRHTLADEIGDPILVDELTEKYLNHGERI